LFPAPIVELITGDVEIVAHATNSLTWLSYGLGLFAIGLVLNQAFNGAGDTMTPTKINFAAYWVVQLPLAYWLSTELLRSPNGIFIAILAAETVMVGFAYYVFRRGRWKLVKV
jgi:Na+-driven multidrug efflux pump